jgi:toxin YhaV
MAYDGWKIFFHRSFLNIYKVLLEDVEKCKKRDPTLYLNQFRTKHLAYIQKAIREICTDPQDPKYRLGKTLGRAHTKWRRAPIGERYRLFFRFFSKTKEIFFVWLNDESCLRKTGDQSDVYKVFKAKLRQGEFPEDRESLIQESDEQGTLPPTTPSPKS